jgi:biotin carboxylase
MERITTRSGVFQKFNSGSGILYVTVWRASFRVGPYFDSALSAMIAHGASQESQTNDLSEVHRCKSRPGLFRGNIDFSVRSIGLPAFWSEEAAE